MPEAILSSPVLRPDWRNAEDYRPMLDYDAASWAGEWLRRNPGFLADLQRAPCRNRSDVSEMDGDVQIAACAERCPLARWGGPLLSGA